MVVFATRKQCEQIIIAMTMVYGSKDMDALKLIGNVQKVLENQCKKDNSHADSIETVVFDE